MGCGTPWTRVSGGGNAVLKSPEGSYRLVSTPSPAPGTPGATVVMMRLVPRPSPIGPHLHRSVDELVYVLSGRLELLIGAERRHLDRGETAFIPRGTVHCHWCHGPEAAEIMMIKTPDTIGPRYYAEIEQVLKAGNPPDRDWIADIMARHDSELVPD